MKYTNVGSYSTALANGMKKVKEYPDPKNTVSYVYAITREEWEKLLESQERMAKNADANENLVERLYKNADAYNDINEPELSITEGSRSRLMSCCQWKR